MRPAPLPVGAPQFLFHPHPWGSQAVVHVLWPPSPLSCGRNMFPRSLTSLRFPPVPVLFPPEPGPQDSGPPAAAAVTRVTIRL